MVVKPSSRWKNMPEPSAFQKNLRSIRDEKIGSGEEILDLTEGDPVIFGHVNQPLSKYLVEARPAWDITFPKLFRYMIHYIL